MSLAAGNGKQRGPGTDPEPLQVNHLEGERHGGYYVRQTLRNPAHVSVHVVSWVLRHSEAKLGQRLVLLVLADHAREDGTWAWPSVETISREARLGERQVQRCLRELEASGEIVKTGVTRKGTNVYTVKGYVEHEARAREGGDNMSGVTSTTLGVTPMSPEPSVEPSVEIPPVGPPARRERKSRALASGWKVDKVAVTEDEDRKARAVLAEWNARTEQRLQSKEWLAKIVMRVREHPELSLIDHGKIIAAALAAPWWDGVASPSVVYGNGAQFERCMAAASGDAAVVKMPRRFGRGMTTAEILQRTGS